MSSCFRPRAPSRFIHRQTRFARARPWGVSLKFERKLASCSDDEASFGRSRSYAGLTPGPDRAFPNGVWSSMHLAEPNLIGGDTRSRPPASFRTHSLPLRHSSSSSSASSILSKDAATAPVDYPTSDRFWRLPPAIAIHLSIGSGRVHRIQIVRGDDIIPRILTLETSSLCLFDVDSANVEDSRCGGGGTDGLDSFGTASSVLVRSRRAGGYNSLLRRVGEINGTPIDNTTDFSIHSEFPYMSFEFFEG